ncbi:inositol monophosphatase family protein [Parvularcula sp. ZS-1/3]|uniref:Inositol monophosphatase family protein n=1 Tax=Parvularcula mediterranea TaxID=2732508 RepID=A0A7Y3RJW8_9PROT|nr:inositol monophosphatase family protein [Parvularcula mediterranea]NNU15437.1 inositol monophosphatase family protein [Parvularcula mediterranea]
MLDKDTLLAFAEDLAKTASIATLQHFRAGTSIDNKAEGGFDPVTEGDRQAETLLRQKIHAKFPGHGIKGEEFPEKEGTEPYRWVIDPIDGTRAFICGVPTWCTLIALEHEGRPIMGIIDQPCLKERWVGLTLPGEEPTLSVQGFLAGRTSGLEDLSAARLMVTDVREGEYFSADEAAAVAKLGSKVRLLRQGLDSYGFGLVAGGQMDLVVEAGLKWHDIAAVIPVIEAADGTVTDWQGAPLTDKGGDIHVIVAATKALADQVSEVLTS